MTPLVEVNSEKIFKTIKKTSSNFFLSIFACVKIFAIFAMAQGLQEINSKPVKKYSHLGISFRGRGVSCNMVFLVNEFEILISGVILSKSWRRGGKVGANFP